MADLVDSLRMNLRQAKEAITVRDQETRRLRAALIHLEGTLSLRERELRDTVRYAIIGDILAFSVVVAPMTASQTNDVNNIQIDCISRPHKRWGQVPVCELVVQGVVDLNRNSK